ncbi:MAG: hypothetical protein ACI31D_08345 [Candidatus Limisoma sp.]
MNYKRLKRYASALGRLRKSKGFGIHSPFAFRFVLRVLKERLPYYGYETIDRAYADARAMIARQGIKHPGIIAPKYAKMIFRVVNHFNPADILQIGTNYGISTTSALTPSSRSHLWIYGIQPRQVDTFKVVTAPLAERINAYADARTAIDDYRTAACEPFIIINDVDVDATASLSERLSEFLGDRCVIIMTAIAHKQQSEALWNEVKTNLRGGMTFSNGRFGVVVCNPKLPVQHFSLWF